jgi:BirA family biotin operon repressor/biotin-[acetyl-CoA-carboxylase] ligase
MRPIGHTILRLEEIASTNSLLLDNEDYLENHGLVAVARHQTGGRGRMGRRWASLPGAQLQFSLVLHPRLEQDDLPAVSLVAGLAVAEALEAQFGLRARLKWPNDVFLAGRKVCGILVEGRPGRGGRPRLVVGIGINCHGRAEDFPPELQAVVTTLAQAVGGPVDAEALLQNLLARLDDLLRRLEGGEKAVLLAEWTRRALLEGQRVRMSTGDGAREAVPLGLSAEGYLILQADNGERFVQVSGDLEWLT